MKGGTTENGGSGMPPLHGHAIPQVGCLPAPPRQLRVLRAVLMLRASIGSLSLLLWSGTWLAATRATPMTPGTSPSPWNAGKTALLHRYITHDYRDVLPSTYDTAFAAKKVFSPELACCWLGMVGARCVSFKALHSFKALQCCPV
jgi:hypothetical protein